jgi:disulfide oxidoreductase YuzD
LAGIYGDEVSIEYFDANAPETQEKYADFIKAVAARRYSYPLVLVNGQLKASGGVDTYQLMFLVDQDRREKGLPPKRI